MLVERHGQRGTPLILIPGLASGAWAWQDTVRQFSGEHVVYVEPDAAQMGMTQERKTAYYTSLMAGTPKLQVVSIAPSRHFVMFDQPQMLADALRAYLKSL